jgi:hypothetical protein
VAYFAGVEARIHATDFEGEMRYGLDALFLFHPTIVLDINEAKIAAKDFVSLILMLKLKTLGAKDLPDMGSIVPSDIFKINYEKDWEKEGDRFIAKIAGSEMMISQAEERGVYHLFYLNMRNKGSFLKSEIDEAIKQSKDFALAVLRYKMKMLRNGSGKEIN